MSEILTYTYTCQHDRCSKTGTERAEFKKAIHQLGSGLTFQYVLCNEHAKRYQETPNE